MEKIRLEKNNGTTSNMFQALVITSDPQYPWTPKMDSYDYSESEAETERVSERLIREQYQDINSYTNSVRKSSIIINGDITAFGHGWQRRKMRGLLGGLNRRYYYGLGNHDIENNKDDCFEDSCFRETMKEYMSHVRSYNLPDFQKDINHYSDIFYEEYSGSFAYAVDFGDIYSIQLNNDPTMNTESSTVIKPHFKIKPNLDWLERQLKHAQNHGKIIFVNVHKPDSWKGEANERFKSLLKEYGVAAVFCGHYHTSCGKYNSQNYFGDVPVFLSGSASQSTYLIVELFVNKLDIYVVRDNNWKERRLEQSIEIDLSTPKGIYTIITTLNYSGLVDIERADNTILLWSYNGGNNQMWNFVYDDKKRAYQIKSMWNEDLVLAWNAIPGSMEVFAHPNEYKDEHYWILEDSSSTGIGGYYIKNKKDPNLVLDVDGANTNNGTKIKVNKRHPSTEKEMTIRAQIFNLSRV